jgi:hypothetical protein
MGKHAGTRDRAERVGLAILDGFLGVTAAIGGLCLLLRVPFVTPPTDLLAESPFGDYTIPGLALLVLVGGGGMLATALVLRRSPWGTAASAMAGLMILVFEAVELVVIGFTGLLALYILLGFTILGLAGQTHFAGRSRATPRPAAS